MESDLSPTASVGRRLSPCVCINCNIYCVNTLVAQRQCFYVYFSHSAQYLHTNIPKYMYVCKYKCRSVNIFFVITYLCTFRVEKYGHTRIYINGKKKTVKRFQIQDTNDTESPQVTSSAVHM
ncbi:unnamed protein product [Ceratitis capitata]|uniref:(Mediterranean fruit fly) hypothetical protein n=1 Tax=Ceratitis capitata TaxID=7213 RepID=A0A811VDJ4_CERCA|nr:unnamed protein product [Ceratitis capitata]